MTNKLHRIAGPSAFLMIVIFMISTLIVETFGNLNNIIMIKKWIMYGLLILIPLMAITGITGILMSKNNAHELVQKKKKRMPYIAINGIFILVPSAIALFFIASNNKVNTSFYIIQSLEIVFGTINLILMYKNFKDGKSLTNIYK